MVIPEGVTVFLMITACFVMMFTIAGCGHLIIYIREENIEKFSRQEALERLHQQQALERVSAPPPETV